MLKSLNECTPQEMLALKASELNRRVNRARLTVGAHLRRGFLLINMVSGVSRHLPFNDAVFFQNDRS